MPRKFSGGEQFKVNHQDHNRWQDAGRWIAERGNGTGGSIELPDEQTGVILVQNTTALNLERFAVLGLRGTISNPTYDSQSLSNFKNQIALKGEVVSSTTSARFCVLQMPALAGEIVPAMVSGVTPCRLNVTAITDEFAEIETDTAVDQTRYLKTGGSGSAQVLYHPEYTGEQWGVVRLGNRSSKNPVLAYFYDHESSPTYTYPARDGVHRKFPAYLWRNATYNNDPTSVGYTTNEAIATPSDWNAEPVFVYNLRNWWIPRSKLLWAFENNGRYYTDYVKPAGPLEYWGGLSFSSAATEDLIPTSSSTIDYGWDGHALTVNDTTGVVTAHRSMRVNFTVNIDLTLSGTATGVLTAFIVHSGNAATTGHTTWQVDDASGTKRSCSLQGTIPNISAGGTFKFRCSADPGSESFSGSFSVTLDSQCDT